MFIFFLNFIFEGSDFRSVYAIKFWNFFLVPIDFIFESVCFIVEYTSGSGLFSDKLLDFASFGLINVLERDDLVFELTQMIFM